MVKIQTESISNFRNNYSTVLERLHTGPLLLMQHSKVAGVLLSQEEWNAISERIEDLEDVAAAWKHKYEKAVGISNTVPFDLAEFVGRDQPTEESGENEELVLVPA
jgi:PHD/YefM family antitoxin component YafN of YafNO toxin-antitoxin module